MARMIPDTGPVDATGSKRAEPDVYWRLAKQLPDGFVVIHSIPWLSAVAHQIDGRSVPTGEIDFLVLHRTLGLLAVEVKGGVFGYDRTSFVYLRTGERIDPVRQVRRGTHSLATWIVTRGGPGLRIGYAILFPDSEVKDRPLPPSVIDPTSSPCQTLILDRRDLPNLGEKILEVMQYWQKQLKVWPLTQEEIEHLIDLICPVADYSPSWQTRIADDDRTWLQLTDSQSKCLRMLIENPRSVVSGWPGTGKTLIAIALARHLAHGNQSTLFLTYNSLLARFLRAQLKDSPQVTVQTFHELCRRAAGLTNHQTSVATSGVSSRDWYEIEAPQVLQTAIEDSKLPSYDALIVDEAQAFHPEWWKILARWMNGKRIATFCDESQVFKFENPSTLDEVTRLIGSESPYVLTLNLRSPRAVFERLQQVRQSSYQQNSPRPVESDALTELAVENPSSTLCELLQQFKEEGIPSDAVTVLYGHQAPPDFVYPEGYTVTVTSIAKFRGLETPIVIIYAPGRPTDASLFCGYSRATSRCIAIYGAYEVVINECGIIGQLLLDSGSRPAIQQAADAGFTANMIQTLGLCMTRVVSRTGDIAWCHDWAAWTVTGRNRPDIATELWLDHLSLVTQAPIYYWDAELRGHLNGIQTSALLTSGRYPDPMGLGWCEACQKVTLFFIYYDKPSACSPCKESVPAGQFADSKEQAARLEEFDIALNLPKDASVDLKRQMTISLIALGRWRTLDESQQSSLASCIGGGSIGYRAALVLTGVDIIRAISGDDIILDDLSDRYFSWSTVLAEQVSLREWRSMVALALSRWKQLGWIDKKEKGFFYRK